MPQQAELFYFDLNGGPNTIAQFSKTDYRSAKVTIQASSDASHQLSEVYLLHDNSLVYIREINYIYSYDPFVDYTATIDANNVYLKATTTLPNTDLVIFGVLFDNPVTTSDKTIDLEKIIESTTSIAALDPTDSTDYAAKITSSLDKNDEIYSLNRKLNESIQYMTSSEFTALSNTEQAQYMTDLTYYINTTSNTLNVTVQSDIQSFYDVGKKVEALSTLTNLNLGYTNKYTKRLIDKVLNANNKTLFGGNKWRY